MDKTLEPTLVPEGEESISFEGKPLKPLKNQKDSLKHAGSLEDNIVLISPPRTGKMAQITEDEREHDHFEDTHTPG